MARGVRQKCRLLLEGREVPFVSAEINCAPNAPKNALIQLVPTSAAKFIRPKTQVHLFVSDTLQFGDPDPRLAFEGEVVSRGRVKTHNTRYITLGATDYSGYWDEAKAYYYNTNFLVGKLEQLITGEPPPEVIVKAAGVKSIRNVATVTSHMLSVLVAEAKRTDLVGAVAKVLATISDANLFYKLAFERLRVADRIIVRSSGRLNEFMKDLQLEEFLASYTGKQGGMLSIREMLFNVMALVFHEFYSMPFPSLVSPTGTTKKTIGEYLFIPDNYPLPPPKCNAVFPNQIVGFEFSEDFRKAPTRFAFRASFPEFLQRETSVVTYPIQYFPQSFRNYMLRNNQRTNLTTAEANSLLGPGTIFTDSKGRNYFDIFYGDKKEKVVGNSLSVRMREADFLTNDEQIRGIFFDMDTFAPSVTALAAGGTSKRSRELFIQSVGEYMFFKKRFSARNASATILFNPHLAPGFNALFLDDSNAELSFIAKVQAITHSLTHESAMTSVALGYAREIDEVDLLSGGTGDPALPPWFDTEVFGKINDINYQLEIDFLKRQKLITESEARERKKVAGVINFPKVSSFYRQTLGVDSILSPKKTGTVDRNPIVTVRGAAIFLRERYKHFSSDSALKDDFVFNYIRRPIPTMSEAMAFLGAFPAGRDSKGKRVVAEEFEVFRATNTGPLKGRFDGKGHPDEKQLQVRRQIIDKYVSELKVQRGFRG